MSNGLPARWEEHFAASPWKPYRRRHALAVRVIAVAETRMEGVWCAYCDAVPAENYKAEEDAVLLAGSKLHEDIALALFPEFKGVPYAW